MIDAAPTETPARLTITPCPVFGTYGAYRTNRDAGWNLTGRVVSVGVSIAPATPCPDSHPRTAVCAVHIGIRPRMP